MKKIFVLILAMMMAFSLVACGDDSGSTAAPTSAGGATPSGEQLTAGVCWYQFSDTFIANARSALDKAAEEDGSIKVTSADSQFDVATQTNNSNNFYSQGVDFLCVNNINTSAKAEMIEQAKENEVTLLFINTDSPSEDEFALYENVWHISSAAEQSGVIMGEQVAAYWEAHPEADRNGDGKLNYVMLLGIQDHYDTQVRAQFSVETCEAMGIETELVQEAVCSYSRAEAQNQTASILQARYDDVEAVFACNDDMALGAIEALKAAGFFEGDDSFIPVVGVDATAVGVEAIKEGTLLGTSLNNPVILGNATYKVMKLLSEAQDINLDTVGLDGIRVEGHHVYIDYVSISADNPEDATY